MLSCLGDIVHINDLISFIIMLKISHKFAFGNNKLLINEYIFSDNSEKFM